MKINDNTFLSNQLNKIGEVLKVTLINESAR